MKMNTRAMMLATTAGLGLAPGAAFGQFAGFSEPQSYAAGEFPWGIAAADFNGDGVDDLVVTNLLQGATVLINDGDGAFGEPLALDAGSGRAQTDPQVADFNEDGHTDIVIPTRNGPYVFLGNGDGTFQTGLHIEIGDTLIGAAAKVEDLNGDGHADLVVNYSPTVGGQTQVGVLLGNGDGTFADPLPPIVDELTTFWDIALGDFNEDGTPELVTSNAYTGDLSVYPGNGDGTFGSPGDFLFVTTFGVTLAVGDLNGDGNLDIANTNGNASSDIDIHFGNGDGTFNPFPFVFSAGAANAVLVIGDVDGDGLSDLLTSGSGQSGLVVSLSNGDGTFADGQTFPSGSMSTRGTLGDFDGNGTPDYATANGNDNAVSVLFNLTEPGEEPCPADRDDDGDGDVQDLLGYLSDFRGGDADFDGDQDTDVQDLLGYLSAFRSGC